MMSQINKNPIDYSPLQKALSSLQEALKNKPANDLERDGVIQRFEYAFELSWKMIRKHLFGLGRASVSSSPKPLLRDAHQENLIEDIEKWFGFLEARNLSSHTYNDKSADEVFQAAQSFPPYVSALIDQLKS